MKKLIALIAVSLFSLSVIAQTDAAQTSTAAPAVAKYKYCAAMKDGKMIVKSEGKDLTADITLTNGIKITKDGNVIKKDGSKIVLKNGDCVDNDGKVLVPEKTDVKKQDMKDPIK